MDKVSITVALTSNFKRKETKATFLFSLHESANALALSWGFGREPAALRCKPQKGT